MGPIPKESSKPAISGMRIAGNIGAVALGALATFGFVQWQDQQSKLDELASLVAQLQQAPAVQVAPEPQEDIVSRNATTDLTAIVSAATAYEETAVENASAAEQLNLLANPPQVADQNTATIQSASRMETFAIIEAGVQVLADAVVAGDYAIHTDYEDEDFSGRIHFAFVGYEESQAELEQFIALAAENGIIAHSPSVVDSDGAISGHIMLFDLVERAMENGTIAEQRAVAKMQREAVEMLASDVDVGEPVNAQGEQYYVVERGDSLAYIALQFYGNTNDYLRIYEANSSLISSPERIRVGQRLLIPEV